MTYEDTEAPVTRAEIRAALTAPPVTRDVYAPRRKHDPAVKLCRECGGTGKWTGPAGTVRCKFCAGTGKA